MRKSIGWGVAQAYRLAGARRRAVLRARMPGTILPVVFHAAKAGEVRRILEWLERKGLLDNAWLSFDDGWREFAETVKVLETFGKPATLFIAPGETRRGKIWTDGLSVPQRQALYGLAEADRYLELAKLQSREHSASLLGEAEIRSLARHPLVRIGNHTWSHMSCTHRPVPEVLDEVDRAQATLTEWCGYAPVDFAYPFGRGTAELDAEIRKRGMTPHYTRQGLVTAETRGAARNMAYEGMSLAENLGRILQTWPKVGTTL